jgi:hypothetical protein
VTTETATAMEMVRQQQQQLGRCQRWLIDSSNKDNASGKCLMVKDCTVALALPLLLPPPCSRPLGPKLEIQHNEKRKESVPTLTGEECLSREEKMVL